MRRHQTTTLPLAEIHRARLLDAPFEGSPLIYVFGDCATDKGAKRPFNTQWKTTTRKRKMQAHLFLYRKGKGPLRSNNSSEHLT